MDLFSDDMRRNPYAFYEQMRSASAVHYVPPPFDAWMIFDYQEVRRALNDHDTFSSQVPALLTGSFSSIRRATLSFAPSSRRPSHRESSQTLNRASGTFRAGCWTKPSRTVRWT